MLATTAVVLISAIACKGFSSDDQSAQEPDLDRRVYAKLLAGESVDFHGAALEAATVERLLLLRSSPSRAFSRGLRMQNCVIRGPLNLSNAEVAFPVGFEGCVFSGPVDFSQSLFRKGLSVVGSRFCGRVNFERAEVREYLAASAARFANETSPAVFTSARLRGGADFDRVTFAGGAAFSRATVVGDLSAAGAVFRGSKTDFRRLSVHGDMTVDAGQFEGPVDFRDVTVTGLLSLRAACFADPTKPVALSGLRAQSLSIANARFAAGLRMSDVALHHSLDGSAATFLGADQPVELRAVDVRHTVLLRGSVFHGPVSLVQCRIGGDLDAGAAHFLKAGAPTLLRDTHVGRSLIVSSSEFRGPVDFGAVVVGFDLNAHEAGFLDEAVGVSFASGQIKHALILERARFRGPADLSHVAVGNNLEGAGAQFEHKGTAANLNSVVIGHTAFFKGATFCGSVDLGAARVESNLEAQGASFRCGNGELNMNSIYIGHTLDCQDVEFHGGVDLRSANIVSNLQAPRARFLHVTKPLDLGNAVVGRSVILSRCRVAGPAEFSGLRAGGDLRLDEVTFTSAASAIQLKNIRVERDLLFENAVFAGGADFTHAAVTLACRGASARFGGRTAFHGLTAGREVSLGQSVFEERVEFEHASAGEGLDLTGVSVADTGRELNLSNVRVRSALVLANVRLPRGVNFENVECGHLVMQAVSVPETVSNPFRVDGLEYQHISVSVAGAVDNPDMLHRPLDVLDRATFSASSYAKLEDSYRRQGDNGHANEVFLAMKERERNQMHWYSVRRAWDWLLYVFVANGTRPSLAILWALGLVVAGYLLFNPVRMERSDSDPAEARTGAAVAGDAGVTGALRRWRYGPEGKFSRFWYSVDTVVPGIDLDLRKRWRPRAECWWVLSCGSVLRLMGWLVIPIGLLTLTGLIKR